MNNRLLSNFAAQLARALEQALKKTNLQRLGNNTVKEIVERVKQGFGIRGRNKSPLKPLSSSYIQKRRKSRLHSSTSASRSNLTFSGSLLDSIIAQVRKYQIIISPSGSKEKAKADYVSKDRPFLDLTDAEEEKLVEQLEAMIANELKKKF